MRVKLAFFEPVCDVISIAGMCAHAKCFVHSVKAFVCEGESEDEVVMTE